MEALGPELLLSKCNTSHKNVESSKSALIEMDRSRLSQSSSRLNITEAKTSYSRDLSPQRFSSERPQSAPPVRTAVGTTCGGASPSSSQKQSSGTGVWEEMVGAYPRHPKLECKAAVRMPLSKQPEGHHWDGFQKTAPHGALFQAAQKSQQPKWSPLAKGSIEASFLAG